MATNGVRGEHQRYITLQQLVSDLTPVAYLWNVIGTYLKIPPGVLRNIKTADGEAFQCLLRMVQQWLEDGQATKTKLVEAVKSPVVRNQRLSNKIAGSKLPDKLEIEHFSDVVDAVADLAGVWFHLGVQLSVNRAILREFQQQPNNVQKELDSMLEVWMKGKPQKEDLFRALRAHGVNKRALANELEKNYRDCILVMKILDDQAESSEVENHTETKPETTQCETLTHPPEPMEVEETQTASGEDLVTMAPAMEQPRRSVIDYDSDEDYKSCSDNESQDEPPEGSDAVISKPANKVPRPEGLPTIQQYFPGFPLQDSRVESDDDGKPAYETYEAYKPDKKKKSVKLSFKEEVKIRRKTKPSVFEAYEMKRPKNRPHGTAVIINNEKFTVATLKDREGTHIDEGNLIETFRHLGYAMEVYRDQSATQIRDIFKKMKGRDHTDCNSFVCCILSHGGEGLIHGADGTPVAIAELVAGINCETLKGKPKMFFFQACRGSGIDKGGATEEPDSPPVPEPAPVPDSAPLPEPVPVPEPRVEADSDPHNIPKDSDFFFGYATPSGKKAWRDLDKGSWYISELCRALCTHATYADINYILERAHENLSKYEHQGNKQASEFVNRLGKNVYFF